MDVAGLKSQIQLNQLDSLYIFTGEEWYLQRLYIAQMAKVRQMTYEYLDDANMLFVRLSAKTLFKEKHVYVLRDDIEILRNSDIIEKLKRVVADNIIVLLYSSADKRTKLYKTYKDTFIEFSLLEHAVLKRHVKAQMQLSDKNIDKLIEVCEGNYGRILLEMEKIKDYEKAICD